MLSAFFIVILSFIMLSVVILNVKAPLWAVMGQEKCRQHRSCPAKVSIHFKQRVH